MSNRISNGLNQIPQELGRITAGMEQWNVGAVGRHWDWSLVERCLIAGRALWFYAAKLVWPCGFILPPRGLTSVARREVCHERQDRP